MAIAEYTSKSFVFRTTPEQAKFLDNCANKSQYIREAIEEKMEREKIEPKQTEDKE